MVRSLLILRPIAYELVKCSVCSGFFRRIVALSYEAADCDRATFKVTRKFSPADLRIWQKIRLSKVGVKYL